MIKQPWHPPYYQRLCEQAGLEKAMDLFMWELVISDRERMLPIIFKLADDVEPRHGITLRKMTRRSLRARPGPLRRRLQRRLERELGLPPYGKKDLDALAQEMQLVFDRNWLMVAETQRGRDRRGGDDLPGHQPGAGEDGRPPAARSAGGTSSAARTSWTACAWAFSA